MIKKWLLQIFINLYLKKNRSIYKLTPEQELKKFGFGCEEDIVDILRAFLTNQTLMYWEARTDYERDIIRGSGLMLRLLQDLHNKSIRVRKEIKNPEAQIKAWLSIKNKLLDEITNQKTH